MEEFFNKTLLDQLYDSISEEFEQSVYEKDNKVREIEENVQDKGEKLTKFLEKVISNKEDFDTAFDLFREYELYYSKEIDFWSKVYFKLGMTYRKKILKDLFEINEKEKDANTFLNYELNELSEYIENQKAKYTFGTKRYKELQKKYNEVCEKYPNSVLVFEDLKPIKLTEDEIKALVELREVDIEMGYMEKNLCFKLGIKEVFNFWYDYYI